jgi:ribonuclease-3
MSFVYDSSMEKDEFLVSWKQHLFSSSFGNIYTHFSENLVHAFCHKSFCHENAKWSSVSYERLEYVGDSVLQVLVTTDLFNQFPSLNEGELSKMRSFLVSQESLVEISDLLELENLLLVGKGELQKSSQSISADIFEAIIGYIFTQTNFEAVSDFWSQVKEVYLEKKQRSFYDVDRFLMTDPKTLLQEYCHKKFKTPPSYSSYPETVDGVQGFWVCLQVGSSYKESCFHVSKKKAEKDLAIHFIKSQNILEKTC